MSNSTSIPHRPTTVRQLIEDITTLLKNGGDIEAITQTHQPSLTHVDTYWLVLVELMTSLVRDNYTSINRLTTSYSLDDPVVIYTARSASTQIEPGKEMPAEPNAISSAPCFLLPYELAGLKTYQPIMRNDNGAWRSCVQTKNAASINKVTIAAHNIAINKQQSLFESLGVMGAKPEDIVTTHLPYNAGYMVSVVANTAMLSPLIIERIFLLDDDRFSTNLYADGVLIMVEHEDGQKWFVSSDGYMDSPARREFYMSLRGTEVKSEEEVRPNSNLVSKEELKNMLATVKPQPPQQTDPVTDDISEVIGVLWKLRKKTKKMLKKLKHLKNGKEPVTPPPLPEDYAPYNPIDDLISLSEECAVAEAEIERQNKYQTHIDERFLRGAEEELKLCGHVSCSMRDLYSDAFMKHGIRMISWSGSDAGRYDCAIYFNVEIQEDFTERAVANCFVVNTRNLIVRVPVTLEIIKNKQYAHCVQEIVEVIAALKS